MDNTGEYKEQVWLLSASDCCVHIFREDKEKQCFYEESATIYFPELQELESIVMWIDIHNLKSSEGIKRITAVGLENGVILLSIVEYDSDANKHIISNCWKVEYDGPVLSVKLFTDRNSFTSKNNHLKHKIKSALNSELVNDMTINLLIANSIEASVVYRDIMNNGLNKRLVLPNSRRFDCTLTSCVADIDMDANNEIAIGTYGHVILVLLNEIFI